MISFFAANLHKIVQNPYLWGHTNRTIMKKLADIFKKYGTYAVAAVVFVVLSYTYCKPQLSGKVVSAGDNISATAAVQEAVRYTQQTGDHTWWIGNMFSGMPDYQVGGGQYTSSRLLAPLDRLLHKGHRDSAWVFIIYFF